MNLRRSAFLHGVNQIGDCGAADNRVIYEHDSFSLDNGLYDAQLDLNTGFTLILTGLYKRPADIAVLVKSDAEWNAGFHRVALRGCQSGIRYADNDICLYGVGLCERCAPADSRVIDGDAVNL